MKLTAEEERTLQRLESKLQHVRDAVRGVVREFHTGLFLHGEGGTSKSYTVMNELIRLNAAYVLHNSRLTGRGLADALHRSPTNIHLIEDAEPLMNDRNACGVLRSALWSQSNRKPVERPVTWGAFKAQLSFIFTGGIIVVSNRNLAEAIPEVRAIKTRINVLGIDISVDEIMALMAKICLDGYRFGDLYLDVNECLGVREFVIARLTELKKNLDLRLMILGFRDMLQWKHGESTLHWQELLSGRMSERVVYRDRRTQMMDKTRAAHEIRGMNLAWPEQLKLAKESGISRATYARAIKRCPD